MEPRIPALPINQYPWYLRFLFKVQLKKFGVILTPSLLWGYTPLQSVAFTLFYLFVSRKKCSIPPQLKSLAMVRVAQIHGCSFCVDLNALLLNQVPGSEEKYFQLQDWKNSPNFSPQEKAVLAYTEAMTQTECAVTEKVFGDLKQFLTDTQVVELTGIIAYQNMSARFNSALNIPPQGLCRITPRSTPPT